MHKHLSLTHSPLNQFLVHSLEKIQTDFSLIKLQQEVYLLIFPDLIFINNHAMPPHFPGFALLYQNIRKYEVASPK